MLPASTHLPPGENPISLRTRFGVYWLGKMLGTILHFVRKRTILQDAAVNPAQREPNIP